MAVQRFGPTYGHEVRHCLRHLSAAIALIVTAGLAAVPAPPASASVYATIEGAGSTWAELIVRQWIADVDADGIRVVYTGGGSSAGRRDFSQNTTDFAISEIPYQGTDEAGQSDTSNGREFSYVPIVGGSIAFTYQLRVGDTLVKNLRLSGRTLARIFTGQITTWNDDQITADNNGRSLPDKVIVPVVRSDGSGATAQFTNWLDTAHPTTWRPYFGTSGSTSYYPRKGDVMKAQAGSDQVMNTVSGFGGDGSIGYIEYAYPLERGYPVAKVLNTAGHFVEPTQLNAAIALTGARVNDDESDPDTHQTQDLTGVYTHPDPRAYPISYYSYLIVATGADDPRMTTAKRQSLADFAHYALCGGQRRSGPYGYAPLPRDLVQVGLDEVARLKQADPAVDLTGHDISTCDNPTFDAGDPDRDLLDESAPMPPACDGVGAGPCGTATDPEPPTGPGPATTRVTFSAPRDRSGVHVVNPRRRYALTVRTTSSQRPRYLHEVPRARAFRGRGTALQPDGRAAGKRVWSLRVQVRPSSGIEKIGVRVGRTTHVLLVRRA